MLVEWLSVDVHEFGLRNALVALGTREAVLVEALVECLRHGLSRLEHLGAAGARHRKALGPAILAHRQIRIRVLDHLHHVKTKPGKARWIISKHHQSAPHATSPATSTVTVPREREATDKAARGSD